MSPSIDTNGWDTVFATSYTSINTELSAQWEALTTKTPSLATINTTLPNGKASVNLTMSAWSITVGGSGSLIHFSLPISTGQYIGIDNTYDLKGQTMVIQLGLQWVPQSKQIQFAISDDVPTIRTDLGAGTTVTDNIVKAFSTGSVTLSTSATISVITSGVSWKITDTSSNMSFYLYSTQTHGVDSLIEVYQYVTNSLVVAPTSAITPVTVISAGNFDDAIDGAIFFEMIEKSIDENLKEFNFVFAEVDVVTQLGAEDNWAWLQPTSNGYAVVEPLNNPTVDNCVFAIMSMVNNRVNPKAVLQVDAAAIAPNCTSSLLISPLQFLHNILAPGVVNCFPGATAADFIVDEGNLAVTNVNPLTWANIELDKEHTVTLSVAPEEFSMGISTDRITLNFSNLNYPMTELGITMGHTQIIFSGDFQLKLMTGTNGNQTLWFDVPADQPNIIDTSATMTKAYYTAEKIIGAVTIAVSILGVVGTAGARIAARAGAATVESAGEATATATAAELQEALKQILSNTLDRAAFVEQAGEDAVAMLENAAVSIQKASVWSTVAKVAGGIAAITGATEGGMGLAQAILEQASASQWDHTPAFTNFADLVVHKYSFAGLKNWTVQSVALAQSLQIGFNAAS